LVQAVARLETQDGKKTVKGPNNEDSNNLFNIKGKGFTALDKAEGSNDSYRVYASRQESINDFISLLERRYPKAYSALQQGDAKTFATELKSGGYATDPKYVDKLMSVIESMKES
jgi:flagellar protein FlgJ